MPHVDSDEVKIHYVDEGVGPAIVLIHGFASSVQGNWRATGVIDALVRSGRRVVAVDCRGHGESEKPHDPAQYAGTVMADDVIRVLDVARVPYADLMGYSMGGYLAASLLIRHPQRFRSAILAGVGEMVERGGPDPERSRRIAEALAAPSIDAVTDPLGKQFRRFAERNGNDLLALAAMQRSERAGFPREALAQLRMPVLVLVGAEDTLARGAQQLADRIPTARFRTVRGDHLTAVNEEYIEAVLSFLGEVSPVPV